MIGSLLHFFRQWRECAPTRSVLIAEYSCPMPRVSITAMITCASSGAASCAGSKPEPEGRLCEEGETIYTLLRDVAQPAPHRARQREAQPPAQQPAVQSACKQLCDQLPSPRYHTAIKNIPRLSPIRAVLCDFSNNRAEPRYSADMFST